MALEKMKPDALREWQAEMGYTWAQAEAALGVGETTYAAWLRGERAIGKHVSLACEKLKDEKKRQGGARKGAGRKRLAEPTLALQIRVPEAHKKVVDERGKEWLRAVIARAVADQ